MWKRIIKMVWNIILFFCLLIVTYLTILRGLFLEEVNALSLNDLSLEDIKTLTKYSSNDIHDWMDEYLTKYDIPIEVLESTEQHQKDLIEDYTNSFLKSVQNNEKIPEIPKEELTSLMIQGIQNYNQKYHQNISTARVQDLVNDVEEKLESALHIIYQNISFFGWFRFLLNDVVYLSFIFITIFFIAVMIFTYKIEFFFSFGGISICSGITLLLTYGLFQISFLQNIVNFLPFDLNILQKTFLKVGIGFLLLGFLCLITYKIITQRKPKNA